jgi:hypothetical protein
MLMTKALHDIGVWAMFAGFDPSALQLKPGLLMDDPTADEVLVRLDQAIATLPAGSAS